MVEGSLKGVFPFLERTESSPDGPSGSSDLLELIFLRVCGFGGSGVWALLLVCGVT